MSVGFCACTVVLLGQIFCDVIPVQAALWISPSFYTSLWTWWSTRPLARLALPYFAPLALLQPVLHGSIYGPSMGDYGRIGDATGTGTVWVFAPLNTDCTLPMWLSIGHCILDTQQCSSASQVISEDSHLYWPLKAPPLAVFFYSAYKMMFFYQYSSTVHSKPMARKVFSNLFAAISPFSLYSHFYPKVDFGVHFVTLDNYAGSSDLLCFTEFSQ